MLEFSLGRGKQMNQLPVPRERVACARRPRAVTMMETVISIFLLLSAFLLVANLFNSGLGYSSRIESQQLAAMIAERQLERMRNWSETLNGATHNYATLASIYNGTVTTVSDFPQFRVATNVITHGIYSGCTAMEQSILNPAVYSPPFIAPRYLPGQASKVVVNVSWHNNGPKSLELATLFSEPALTFATAANPLTVTGSVPATLARGASVQFSVAATDSNSSPISGLIYSWALMPINGTGTLTQARDGSTAELTNQIYGLPLNPAAPFNGTACFTGGQCQLQVSAMYHGQLVDTTTPVINLAP